MNNEIDVCIATVQNIKKAAAVSVQIVQIGKIGQIVQIVRCNCIIARRTCASGQGSTQHMKLNF